MLSLLKAFFLVLLAAIVAGVIILLQLFRSVRRSAKQFRDQMDAMNGGQQTTGQGSQQTTQPNGDIIIDTRDPEKASQKIFDKDEGEYVDFKE